MTKDNDVSANLGLLPGNDASPEEHHQVLVEESSRDLEEFFAIREDQRGGQENPEEDREPEHRIRGHAHWEYST
jgi:hypothetical protein